MCCPAHSSSSKAHSYDHAPDRVHQTLAIAAKVSVVALAVLAFVADKTLFYPYFAVGFVIGAYKRWDLGKPAEQAIRTESIAFSGLIENITGVHLPALMCLGINVSSYSCHIDHHPDLFVPATALAVGAWVGHSTMGLIQERLR